MINKPYKHNSMKKLLLTVAALSAMTAANAQTYNYFDPADCDADGWLWLNTQEKLDKYCGFIIPGEAEYKIGLLSATWENSDMQFDEPYLDATIQGYDADHQQGGAGSWTGAIVLCGSKSALGSDAANGGGIIMRFPDLAEFNLALSSEGNMGVGLLGSKGWVEDVDCSNIQTNFRVGIWGTDLSKNGQFVWNNIQDVENANTGLKLASPKGDKVTAVIRNNRGDDLLVQGIKVMTYTQTSGISGITADEDAPVEYFNLQGLKADKDMPGVYVRRQGNKVSKVIVK